MSEEKFTPRPWEIKLEAPYLLQIVKAGDKRVAVVPTKAMSSGDAKEGKANAHLIAAAPELYNALHDVCSNCSEPDDLNDPTVCICCDIGCALWRARGEDAGV